MQVSAEREIATTKIWIGRVKHIMGASTPQCQGGRVRLIFSKKHFWDQTLLLLSFFRPGTPHLPTTTTTGTLRRSRTSAATQMGILGLGLNRCCKHLTVTSCRELIFFFSFLFQVLHHRPREKVGALSRPYLPWRWSLSPQPPPPPTPPSSSSSSSTWENNHFSKIFTNNELCIISIFMTGLILLLQKWITCDFHRLLILVLSECKMMSAKWVTADILRAHLKTHRGEKSNVTQWRKV